MRAHRFHGLVHRHLSRRPRCRLRAVCSVIASRRCLRVRSRVSIGPPLASRLFASPGAWSASVLRPFSGPPSVRVSGPRSLAGALSGSVCSRRVYARRALRVGASAPGGFRPLLLARLRWSSVAARSLAPRPLSRGPCGRAALGAHRSASFASALALAGSRRLRIARQALTCSALRLGLLDVIASVGSALTSGLAPSGSRSPWRCVTSTPRALSRAAVIRSLVRLAVSGSRPRRSPRELLVRSAAVRARALATASRWSARLQARALRSALRSPLRSRALACFGFTAALSRLGRRRPAPDSSPRSRASTPQLRLRALALSLGRCRARALALSLSLRSPRGSRPLAGSPRSSGLAPFGLRLRLASALSRFGLRRSARDSPPRSRASAPQLRLRALALSLGRRRSRALALQLLLRASGLSPSGSSYAPLGARALRFAFGSPPGLAPAPPASRSPPRPRAPARLDVRDPKSVLSG